MQQTGQEDVSKTWADEAAVAVGFLSQGMRAIIMLTTDRVDRKCDFRARLDFALIVLEESTDERPSSSILLFQ